MATPHDPRVRRIFIEPQAPAKPRAGAPCNGCGICCLSAPCPLGMLLSRRTQGACAALHWEPAAAQYRCGALVDPVPVLRAALPRPLRWVAPRLATGFRFLARRWIASGYGCDSTLEVASREALPAQAPAAVAPSSAAPETAASRISTPLLSTNSSWNAKP